MKQKKKHGLDRFHGNGPYGKFKKNKKYKKKSKQNSGNGILEAIN